MNKGNRDGRMAWVRGKLPAGKLRSVELCIKGLFAKVMKVLENVRMEEVWEVRDAMSLIAIKPIAINDSDKSFVLKIVVKKCKQILKYLISFYPIS